MKGFFKYLLASVLGFLIASFLVFIIMIGIFAGIASSSDKPTEVSPNSVLKISLNQQVFDRASDNPLEGMTPFNFSTEKAFGLNDILKNIEKAKTDQHIEGIFLDLTSVPAGMAQIQEIRASLLDFKESGKFIIAHSFMYSQTAYYLASVADKVYLTPEGALDYRGIAANVVFIKNALTKMGLKAQIIKGKDNKFKSAVEPYFLTQMSEANKKQTLVYINSIWGQMLQAISESRNISVEKLNEMADNFSIVSDKDAKEFGLIDDLKYYDEIVVELKDSLGLKETKKVKMVSLRKYFSAKAKTDEGKKEISRDKIAVVYAQGTIGMDGGSFYDIGTENISSALAKVRRDSSVKAVVFRVNSPGGSALTSELIYREALLTAQAKPFIVSMGTYAASGGYYISCMADEIYADPTTLTGSIGVYGVIMSGTELINDKLGLNIDGVKTNEFADFGGAGLPMPLFGAVADRDLTAQEREIIQRSVTQVYNTFVGHVAEGRGMTYEEVDAIGQGRVWTGENAIEIGLVDKLGGLNDAIEAAKLAAGLEDYKRVEYPVQKDPIQEIIEELTGQVKMKQMKALLGADYIHYMNIEKALSYRGIQARMPFNIEVY